MPPPSLKELENSLNRVYLRIFKAINREEDYPDNLQAIQRKYNKIVYDNTRSAIQQAVILANERVNKLYKTQPYLTQSDLDLIKKNTKDNVDSFWRKIILDIFRKQEQRLLGGAAVGDVEDDVSLEPPPDLDLSSYLLAVAITSIFSSFADSTLSKTQELGDTIENKPKVEWQTVMDERTCDRLSDGAEGCGPRNGKIYDADDEELRTHMPGSMHPYCRCQLIPII